MVATSTTRRQPTGGEPADPAGEPTTASLSSRADREGHRRGRPSTGSGQALCNIDLAAWAVPLALFAGALAVYIRTMRPSFDWLDNSELITAAYHLGIGHNPGYPTLMLIGHAFSWLPIGAIAYRLNLMNAAFGALAVALLYLVCLRVTGRASAPAVGTHLAAGLAALTAAFSYTFWELTTETDAFTLHAVFMLAIVLLLLRWRDGSGARDLYLAWLIIGVSLGNHPLTTLLIPAVAALMILEHGRGIVSWRQLWRCAAALAAGLSVYLYIPLRALADPPPGVNNPHNLAQLWQLLSAPAYHQFMFHLSAAQVGLRALRFAQQTARELGPIGIGGALLGIGFSLRRDWRLAAALLILIGVDVAYAINYNIFDIYAYFMPAYLALAIFLAVGLERALAWGEKGMALLQRGIEDSLTRPRRIALVAAVLTYLPVWAFSTNFRPLDASRDRAAEDFARNTFAVVERGAVIIGDWYSIAPLGYLRYVEGLRPDVTLSVALSSPWPGALARVMRRSFLAGYPAAYVVEHQTARKRAFTSRYPSEPVGDLVRLYPRGGPRLRAVAGPGAILNRFGESLGLIETRCEPARVPQGGIVTITHMWRRLGPLRPSGSAEPALSLSKGVSPATTLTTLDGRDGCIWAASADLANGFYDGQSWRVGEVAAERHVVFIPSDAPPGEYAITVRVRRPDAHKCMVVSGPRRGGRAFAPVTAKIRIVARKDRSEPTTFAPRHW